MKIKATIERQVVSKYGIAGEPRTEIEVEDVVLNISKKEIDKLLAIKKKKR